MSSDKKDLNWAWSAFGDEPSKRRKWWNGGEKVQPERYVEMEHPRGSVVQHLYYKNELRFTRAAINDRWTVPLGREEPLW